MTHVTCRLTAKNRDQLRKPTVGYRVWAISTFLLATVLIISWESSYQILCTLSLPSAGLCFKFQGIFFANFEWTLLDFHSSQNFTKFPESLELPRGCQWQSKNLISATYIVKVVVSKKWCEIDMLLLHNTDRKYHMAYLFVPFPLTFVWPWRSFAQCWTYQMQFDEHLSDVWFLLAWRVARSLGDSSVCCSK